MDRGKRNDKKDEEGGYTTAKAVWYGMILYNVDVPNQLPSIIL